jgi:hypothetical protein
MIPGVGGSILYICRALLAGRGLIIAERLKRPWPRLNDITRITIDHGLGYQDLVELTYAPVS